MTAIEKEIMQKMQRATFNPPEILRGQVIEVDEASMTCTVAHGGVEYYEVQLRTVVDDEDFLVVIPQAGTMVTFAMLEYSNRYQVLAVATPASFFYQQKKMKIQVDSEGVAVENQGEQLAELIEELITEIGNITVPTSSGPSGQPVNLPKFEALKLKFKKILKNAK